MPGVAGLTRRIRAGVIGAGSWAVAAHLPLLAAQDDVEIVVVCRRDADLARSIADRFGARHATPDWQEAIRHDLDVVVVASPPNVHEEQVTAALDAGAHVLCEKPFAIAAAAAWRMAGAAERTGRTLLVSFGWNYTPLMQAARRLLLDGPIGAIEFLTIGVRMAGRDLLMRGLPYGDSAVDVPPNAETFVVPQVSGGGEAPVTMSHVFGLALYLTGLAPRTVVAGMWDGPLGVDVHDATVVGFDGGAVGSLTAASSHRATAGAEWNIAVIGSGGQVQLESDPVRLRFISDRGRVLVPDLPVDPYARSTTGPLEALLGVARGIPAGDESGPRMAALTVELVEKSLLSARSHRAETIGDGARAG